MDLQQLDNEVTNAENEMEEACVIYNHVDSVLDRLTDVVRANFAHPTQHKENRFENEVEKIRKEYAKKYQEAKENTYQAIKAYDEAAGIEEN